MMENRQRELAAESGSLRLNFHTFEVKTLRLQLAKV